MRNKLWLLPVALLLLGTASCRNIFIQDNGPSVVRTAVSFGVQFTLVELKPEPAVVQQIIGYLNDGKGILQNGNAPANALDTLADFLNSKIPWEGFRQAIQAGIIAIQQYVKIPMDGIVTPKVAVWVYAILDGAIDGCNAYLGGYAYGRAPGIAVSDKITFRNAQVTFR